MPESSNRRQFFKQSAVASLVMSAAGYRRVQGANGRIRVGIIGVGSQGYNYHLLGLLEHGEEYGCEIAAVCDVYRRRLKRAMEKAGCEGFMDYREVLGRDDIDAVIIVTPDHWHAKIAIEAMEAGKHVYCEKPMTLTIEQAFQVREAVHRTGKVFQVGPQRTADDQFWKAQELIRAGRVGPVTWAQGGYNRNVRGCAFNVWFPVDETAGPDKSGDDYINWDLWLGHEWGLADKIPWNPEHFFRFRKYWPYNGGVATDLLYHILAPLLISITGNHGEYPLRVNAGGGLYLLKDGRDIPDVFTMSADYPSEFTVHLLSMLTNDTPIPVRICGQYGTIDIDRDLTVSGNGDYVSEFRERNGGYEKIVVPLDERPDLWRNFFDCIRHGGEPYANVELGTATMVAIKLGVEAYRQNRTMLWDPKENRLKA